MTTFAAGSGQRLKVLDLGACYTAGTVVWFATQGYWSASWSGNVKIWDIYIIGGASLADLAAAEAAVTAGSGWLYHTTKQATSDSTGGFESMITATNQNTAAFPATYRYISLYAKPQFSAVNWYTNDASTLALGPSGVVGSTTACPATVPVANFTGTPLSGLAPLSVAFTDTSTNTPTGWNWDFGDGGTSASQNPTHIYTVPGTYTVSLEASNSGGSDVETKVGYVRVLLPTTDDVHEIIPPGDTIGFVGTLDDAFNKAIRPVRNEPGSGQFSINRYSPNATASILKPGNLVKVTIPQIDPDPIFAWFMEQGDFKLVSTDEQGGEDITIGGRGALSYWDRAVWLSEKFVIPWWDAGWGTPPAGAKGHVEFEAGSYRRYTIAGGVITGYTNFTTAGFEAYFQERETKQWPSASSKRFLVKIMAGETNAGWYVHPHQDGVTETLPTYAVGTSTSVLLSDISPDTPGAILYHLFLEGQDPGRPTQPIPLMTVDFTATLDSDGNAWSTTDALAGLTAELGETYLDTIAKLLSTGVIDVEMGPDLDMHAYNSLGRDLSATSFGAGKVRFVKGVNIADELRRERDDNPVATFIEVVGTDNVIGRAVLADAATRVARETSGTGDSADETVLEAIGLASLNARLISSDAIGFRIATGDDDATGLYLPGPEGTDNGDFWLGDVVTLHTGTGEQDFDQEDERVYAITIAEDEAGNLEVTPEVGSVLGEAERRLYANTTSRSVSFTSRSQFTDTEVAEPSTDAQAHIDDTADAHDASAVSFSPAAGIAATDVQAAIVEDAGDLAAHLSDTSAAHAASAIGFTPNGSIAATDVQAAIQEVRDEAVGGSGALVLLEQHTASASASLAFTTFISATYDEYMIEGVEVAPATDNVGFTMNVGTGAGPTYDTGTNYAYTMVGRTMGDAAHNAGGVGGTAAFLMYNVSNNAGYGFGNFSLKVAALQSTAHRKMFHGTCVYTNNVPTHVGDVVSLIWTTTATAATALRFQFTSGNIASGTIRIYGIVK